MRNRKGKCGISILALIAGITLLSAAGALSDESGKYKVPEIKRIAIFQNQGGERLFSSPLSIARDESNGDLFVTNLEAGEVVILNKSGTLIKRLGSQTGLSSPYGVAVDEKGQIYISEMHTGFLKIFNPAGMPLDEVDLSELSGRVVSPGRITRGRNGYIYVADIRNNEILVLSEKGALIKSVGGFEYLQKAGALKGNILGLSAMGKAVRIFDKEGALLQSYGEHGDESQKNFSFPTGFTVDSKGRLWIADAFQHRLKVLSPEGRLLFNFGGVSDKAWTFFFPVDICFGPKGELFVLEKGAERIQVFQVSDLKE